MHNFSDIFSSICEALKYEHSLHTLFCVFSVVRICQKKLASPLQLCVEDAVQCAPSRRAPPAWACPGAPPPGTRREALAGSGHPATGGISEQV